ncbi:serine O-acetyltransferase [Gymnodinialimonas hymeniacidonis]|uniref:serine O-acetyltransferase n=1 Tax=Gymnodinialimonas hymeniacidonis TaxID=3126508 RepID=UPI0034C66596
MARLRDIESKTLPVGALLDADWARFSSYSGIARRRRMRDSLSFRFLPNVLIRRAHAFHKSGGVFGAVLSKLACLMLFVLYGLEYPARLCIGPGLVIFHTQGTILGANRIGANASIYQQVTLGAVQPDFQYTAALRPTIGDNVSLTAGAKVIGGITVGDGSVVGANAVVLDDVPANTLAVGVPARHIPRDASVDATTSSPET